MENPGGKKLKRPENHHVGLDADFPDQAKPAS
jgi:hypothetical protein